MKAILLAICIFSLGNLSAQGVFDFYETEYDFGEISEGKAVSKIFSFRNTGGSPILINKVWASCGCTTPEWPKEAIMPGDSSMIKVVFNSEGRPGTFYKTISISSDAADPIIKLVIKGNVVRPGSKVLENVNGSSVYLELNEQSYNFGVIQVGDKLYRKVLVKNKGERSVFIQDIETECSCVRMKGGGKFISPKEEIEIEIIFTPKMLVATPIQIQFRVSDTYSANYSLKGQVVEKMIEKSAVMESDIYDFR